MKVFPRVQVFWLALAVLLLGVVYFTSVKAATSQYSYDSISFPSQAAMQKYQSKTARFIHSMLPIIDKVDQSLAAQRKRLLALHKAFESGKTLSSQSIEWVKATAKYYKIKQFDFYSSSDWKQLITRLDVIPPSLVIAQSANESAWGKSSFAKQGNNYFGQHCYVKGCGIVPSQRKPGSKMEVAKFPSVKASVEAYMHNLNTQGAYKDLRKIRAQLRKDNKPLTGYALAEGLLHYSARGSAYVKSIRSIITGFHLEQYDKAADK